MIHANQGQIEAVLKNLIQNARLHGRPPVSVEVDGEVSGEVSGAGPAVQIRVIDAGEISPANVDKIFDRFFTTARSRGGTGLGLALVRTICTAHGGSITVESRPGRTCFEISLPRLKEPHA